MNKNKWLFFVIAFMGFLQAAHAKIVCEAKHTLYHDDFEIKATYRFVVSDDNGVILINGTSRSDRQQYTLSREVYFSYHKQSGNDYILSSNRIIKNPIDTLPETLALKHYPVFFIEKDNKLTFFIKHVNRTDYIISFVSTPLFYCNGT
ncbi:hypothetical protein [Klebsiella quasivariicola]|uniref:hypothetical protein n=1 Tax=Klebsiella quasivariicola TaxID=2026240 RepID=UPI001CCC4041|nr:hypothetical protein [Klebsiella quasivariicola]MBZ9580691.1 hypothetical protein [Klebsiella quasivariicola]